MLQFQLDSYMNAVRFMVRNGRENPKCSLNGEDTRYDRYNPNHHETGIDIVIVAMHFIRLLLIIIDVICFDYTVQVLVLAGVMCDESRILTIVI